MSRVSCLVSLVALTATSLAQPGSGPGAWVPGWNQEMPNYFSGTNCRASGTGVAYHGFILSAELSVNNAIVANYAYLPGEPIPMSVHLAAM